MKTKWSKAAFIVLLALAMACCTTALKEEQSDKGIPEKNENLQKEDETKTEKLDLGRLDRSDEKTIRKMAKEITRERGEDFFLTGINEYNKGDFEDAVEAFSKAVNEDPKDFRSYFFLGQSHEKLNQAKEAAEAYLEAIKIRSNYLPAQEAVGLVYFQQRQFKEAETHLREAQKLGSKIAEVYYGLGEIEQRKDSCETAIIAYEQALRLNPDYLAARNGLKVAKYACRQKKIQ